ncbi:hypothetical protein GHT06_001876 [Daphnia sinensis]|uniref:Uncharacterized protein n=1 Tax=Daphnia sinensis TaxID=1820382 RepID=A0AAD5KTH4_9CRUS|nr:hypothetical protein GHT06_001876 [Daphnia sinensis]
MGTIVYIMDKEIERLEILPSGKIDPDTWDMRHAHREGNPAIVWMDGEQWWVFNGKNHRKDGPAIESSEFKAWNVNGKMHRIDGPAIEYASGRNVYYLDDKFMEPQKWKTEVRKYYDTDEDYLLMLLKLD